MNPADLIAYESRVRVRYGWIAFAAAVLIVGSQLLQLSGVHTSVNELTLTLITVNKRFPIDLVGAVLNAIGYIALALLLAFLAKISGLRNPEYRSFIGKLAYAGAGVSALCSLVYWVILSEKAHTFVNTGLQSYPQARALMSGWGIVAPQILGELGALMLAAAVIWIALNAMRVGLLFKPMGYAGVFAGALILFPIGAIVPVVQGAWLASVALLVGGRWPAAEPAAWDAGMAVPWAMTASQLSRQQAAAARRAARSGNAAVATNAGAVVDAEDSDARTRSNTPKRKRKKR